MHHKGTGNTGWSSSHSRK